MPHDRPAHRDPLPLAAGKRSWPAMQQRLDTSSEATSRTRTSMARRPIRLALSAKVMFWYALRCGYSA